ncbi:MAG: helix-turn-helix transcriptional regulator, partial [Dehalococcoidia bacterium]|nr:helix-turn-helix transcriptional regulator [Dehalococcoidia bacterium]
MTERELLAGEWAVLGVLRLEPKHGYEIARALEQDGLPDVTRIEQNLLYAYLKTLERRDLIAGHEVRVGAYPPRRVFDLTAAGRAEIDSWLRKTVHRLREVRLEFMLKLYVLHQLDTDAERALLEGQIEVVEAYVDRFSARLAVAPSHGFERLVLGSKVSAAEATLAWLRSYASELGQVVSSVDGPSNGRRAQPA